ncbi:MAG: AMP-binding protein [Gammaproteobacteria bacterium]|nr:AMP-binding protein [Gammaproteobacteria bacterium]
MTPLLTLSDAIAAQARLQPEKIGARESRRALVYRAWNERASRLANVLLDRGLAPGDRVAVLGYNCLEWMEIYVALARAGLVAVPINFRLLGDEISYIVKHCEAKAFIAQDELCARVEAIRGELPVIAGGYIAFRPGAAACAVPGWQAYETLLAAASAEDPGIAVKADDAWALMYTSGTTGRPKGAIRSHAGSALIGLVAALDIGLGRDDTALLVMPLCHANSLYFAFTFAYLGATSVIDDSRHFEPEALLALLARERVTFTSLVPTHYIMMLGLPEDVKARHDVSAVGKLLVSSAPARRETKLAILQHFRNSQLFELYGSTEAGWVTWLRPEEQLTKLGSVGRECTATGAIRILDAEGREVPDGEVGELYSRTPFVFDGYWKDPEKTAAAFRGAWCSVGDMAYRDADGYYYLVDRKSNMIISGGENVYPSEVESLLAGHPAVKDVAVIGVPHEKWGEAVHAIVVPHDGVTVTEREILDWCRDKIAGYKRPGSIAFITETEMPRTATGKILHRVLRERAGSVFG